MLKSFFQFSSSYVLFIILWIVYEEIFPEPLDGIVWIGLPIMTILLLLFIFTIVNKVLYTINFNRNFKPLLSIVTTAFVGFFLSFFITKINADVNLGILFGLISFP
jgi:hypothetical protein